MEREKEDPQYRQEILSDLYEKLWDLYDLEEKGWQVNPAIEKN